MRSSKTVHVISAHAEGEVGDVIVGGVAPPPQVSAMSHAPADARGLGQGGGVGEDVAHDGLGVGG